MVKISHVLFVWKYLFYALIDHLNTVADYRTLKSTISLRTLEILFYQFVLLLSFLEAGYFFSLFVFVIFSDFFFFFIHLSVFTGIIFLGSKLLLGSEELCLINSGKSSALISFGLSTSLFCTLSFSVLCLVSVCVYQPYISLSSFSHLLLSVLCVINR